MGGEARSVGRHATAPEATGELVAAIPRPGFKGRPDAELQVRLDSYQGRPYISVREWTTGRFGAMFPTRSGTSVRLHEARAVAAAILAALDRSGVTPTPVASSEGLEGSEVVS